MAGFTGGIRVNARDVLLGSLKSAFILAAGALGTIAVYHFSGEPKTLSEPLSGPSNSSVDSPQSVHALGSIQPRDGIVELALPTGYRATRFDNAIVQGGPVKKGQVIAYLEGYETSLQEVAVIDAQIVAAQVAIEIEDENERMTLAEIDRECEQVREIGAMEHASMELKIAALNDKYLLCQKQFDDVKGLQVDNSVPRQQYDQLLAQSNISREELNYAKAEAKRAAMELKLNTSDQKIEQQKRRVRVLAQRARSQISLDTLRKKKSLSVEMLERSKVHSPIDGVVLEICTKVGESGAGKPLVKLGDTRQMYVLAEIYEDDRRLVREKQRVEVRGRGLPGDGGRMIMGTVERISPIIGTHKQSPLDPTSRDNARVYPAWIALDSGAEKAGPKSNIASLQRFILQPVEVTILLGDTKPADR